MTEYEPRKKTEVDLKSEKILKVVGSILKSDYAEAYVDLDYIEGKAEYPMDYDFLTSLGEILESEGFRVLDNETDEDVIQVSSYGVLLRIGYRYTRFYPESLTPEFVITYLEAKSEHPDAIINYRLGKDGIVPSIEVPNPNYDPSKAKVRLGNPRYVAMTNVRKYMDGIYTGFHVDPGKHDR